MSTGSIVAIATPTGRSGIGVIRVSGGDALRITRKLVSDPQFSPEPRHATLKQLHDPFTKEVIDEAIITYFKAPHSFTGEDVVEISCHGSPVLLRQVIDLCLRLDARMAEAGEFSRSDRCADDGVRTTGGSATAGRIFERTPADQRRTA